MADTNDLPKISKKAQKFVSRYCTNGENGSEAYRFSYDASNMKPNTVWKEASKLLNNPKVAPWIKYYKENAAETAKDEIDYSLQKAFSEANELLLMALEPQGKYKEPNIPTALKAFELKNRLKGNFEKDNEQQNNENTIINVIRPEHKSCE